MASPAQKLACQRANKVFTGGRLAGRRRGGNHERTQLNTNEEALLHRGVFASVF
jgi:hypothetical protein